jgi:hypothetical protein
MVEAAYRVKVHIHPATSRQNVAAKSQPVSVAAMPHRPKKRASPCGNGKHAPMRALPQRPNMS